jgi:hypothetical protein
MQPKCNRKKVAQVITDLRQSISRLVLIALAVLASSFAAFAQDSWQAVLSRMPLEPATRELNRTNCVAAMFGAFREDPVVKGLIFMPGATDEMYMFHRVTATLTNDAPTLLDAVTALTNQTFIRVAFQPPFVLLHSGEDSLQPIVTIESSKALQHVKQAGVLPRLLSNDRDWDYMQPILRKIFSADIRPWRYTTDSWHFYRHSLSAWNLTGWETLEAVALAGKTRMTIRRNGIFSFPRDQIIFAPDQRVRELPKLDRFPR